DGADTSIGRAQAMQLDSQDTHIKTHMAVSYVAAGQTAGPHWREEPASYRPTAIARKHGPERGRAGRQIRNSGRATPSLRHASGHTSSSRLTRCSHPVRRAAEATTPRRALMLGNAVW